MTAMQDMMKDPHVNLVLSLADDLLMLGHVQGDWTGLGPILEEDIASSSMSQDDLSHALMLYEHLGSRFGLDPDVVAYERGIGDYRCCDLVTVPDEFDWAVAFVRRWMLAHWAAPLLDHLIRTGDDDLQERCRRLRAEQALHLMYLDDWMRRLGTGAVEARDRMQAAIERISPLAGMLVETPDGVATSEFDALRSDWIAGMEEVAAAAGLSLDIELPSPDTLGGRRGVHAEHFIQQHTEMNEVRCADPGASW